MESVYEPSKAKTENLDYFLNTAVEPVLIPEKARFDIWFVWYEAYKLYDIYYMI